ncbi:MULTISPECIES: S8 family serine peptidase [unclassified Bradyrhizobium]|uniref:S8 family serine peptidase n=1 Tax=unclassified Bradyrhizobium TaxID=2631580 RepID=UPI001BA839A0|nr:MULTISPECIES: S8 family serine peptidase [unclassified Bradyrhizobium]MBR1202303.1 S8 family serine peptidase [Bradyrhizobium sp. AUGA SZCCT0124]MBR1311128.1 S8 family serine peptidase [Bradyrhizobium sp. AUGA SZCCT0051]MBR1339252.1 S8 family serine peptidase [Bradyrhizobium sp. AUGA SZCCT0105]MBR1353826.1 S8 family serine peptidase [Bradyrhizobium sp. AUGA SZCCT0045]
MTANGRTRSTNRAAIAAAVLLLVSVAGSAYAQNFVRSPIGGRPLSIGPRVNPGIGGAGGGLADRAPLHGPATSWTGDGPRSGMPPPRVHDAPRFSADCDDGTRQCSGRPVSVNGGGKGAARKGRAGGGGSSRAQDVAATRTVPNELVAEIDGALTETQTDALARRHGLRRIASQNIPLLGATIGLFRTAGNRSADAVARDLASDSSVRSVQPNYRYALQDQKPAAGGSDPAQYAQTQLHLPEAHRLARGMNVTIAVIDSGIDAAHPELANTVADTFDALGSKDGPHAHGTAVAGVIAARVRLTGSAPEVRILAIRAFGAAAGGAESTSYVILRSLDYAVAHGAQIVNMSFAGPQDALVARAVAAAAARDIVLVAAAGNAGPKSPPLYPAANPDVIAVGGIDAGERLMAASNRGSYVALAAPGADLLVPVPDGKYQLMSGTSFSAAFVSGISALVLERNPALKPAEVRKVLTGTARDLGASGRDDLFGAGEADALAAVTAATSAPVAATVDEPPQPAKAADGNNTSVSRALNEPAPSIAADDSAANHRAAQ